MRDAEPSDACVAQPGEMNQDVHTLQAGIDPAYLGALRRQDSLHLRQDGE